MPLRAPPTGADRNAEPDVPYSAGAALRSRRDAFASVGLRLVERVGAGGSSEVWRALDTRDRSVALKIPLSEAPWQDAFARLEREHEVLAAARHGHIVESHGLVEHDGVCALALEYLPGGDLVSLAGTHPRHWLRAVFDVHSALTHLHSRGFAHRDVKARNVLFDARGRARLIDFASALPLGAPAQHGGTTAAHLRSGRNPVVTAADDAYAYAVLLYELIAGRLPYGPAGRSGMQPASRGRLTPPGGRKGPVARLAARVRDVLEADCRRAPGLSVFADVLESALPASFEPAGIGSVHASNPQ